jgi:uncharacterized damage-inducible protein DinB
MLEAVPDDQLDFKPHEKSVAMGGLIRHLVTIPDWAAQTLQSESLDFTGFVPPPPVKSRAEALDVFQKGAADGRAAIAAAADDAFHQNWTLSGNGQVFFTIPRYKAIRSFVMNHLIHHRAQLAMYLRLCGAKVPGMYGPSADETM